MKENAIQTGKISEKIRMRDIRQKRRNREKVSLREIFSECNQVAQVIEFCVQTANVEMKCFGIVQVQSGKMNGGAKV